MNATNGLISGKVILGGGWLALREAFDWRNIRHFRLEEAPPFTLR